MFYVEPVVTIRPIHVNPLPPIFNLKLMFHVEPFPTSFFPPDLTTQPFNHLTPLHSTL